MSSSPLVQPILLAPRPPCSSLCRSWACCVRNILPFPHLPYDTVPGYWLSATQRAASKQPTCSTCAFLAPVSQQAATLGGAAVRSEERVQWTRVACWAGRPREAPYSSLRVDSAPPPRRVYGMAHYHSPSPSSLPCRRPAGRPPADRARARASASSGRTAPGAPTGGVVYRLWRLCLPTAWLWSRHHQLPAAPLFAHARILYSIAHAVQQSLPHPPIGTLPAHLQATSGTASVLTPQHSPPPMPCPPPGWLARSPAGAL